MQSLLDYAASKSPPGYRFVLHRELSVPAPTGSADFVTAFSLFTHLLHEESFVYLQDIQRVLRPGGSLVLSFLEFAEPEHWGIFQATVSYPPPHLNVFIERPALDLWARCLGFDTGGYIDATAHPWGELGPLGQTVAVLRKPE